MFRNSNGFKIRLIIGLVIAAFAVFQYYSNTTTNEITGEKQHISISPEQEIQLGLDGRDYMIQQSGGLYPDEQIQTEIDNIGAEIVQKSDASKTPYHYEFHVLEDPKYSECFCYAWWSDFYNCWFAQKIAK